MNAAHQLYQAWSRPDVVFRIALATIVRIALAAAVLIVGELIFRGFEATTSWIAGAPITVAVSCLYLSLCIVGLELIFTLRASTVTVASVFWVFSFANHTKVAQLGVPASPTDLLLVGQYLEVGMMLWGRITYILAAMVTVGVTALLVWAAWRRFRAGLGALPLLALRAAAIAAAFLLLALPDYNFHVARFRHSRVAAKLDDWGISNINFVPAENARRNGELLSFLMNARSAFVHPPVGYSEERVYQALASKNIGRDAAEGDSPDIVVIMNEAWWDPTALPDVGFTDPLLNQANATQRGSIFSPVFGGYTANTEFEFLTRVSNGMLPNGSIPYVQYVKRPTESVVADMKRAGYSANALHPFDGNFWNRRQVYKDFGFDDFRDENEFAHRTTSGPYINDHALAGEIKTVLAQGTKPHFVFAVSVQNHAPYGGIRYGADMVNVDDKAHRLDEDAKHTLANYATGVRDAVLSFNEVVAYFRQSGRKGIVVMFGDHLPALGDEFLVYRETGFLGSSNQDTWSDEDQLHMHTTPLLVWSNTGRTMDLPNTAFSPIYLAGKVRQQAGLGLNPVDMLLNRTEKAYPVLSQFYSRSANGSVVRSMAPLGEAGIEDYANVAYDLLLGRDYVTKQLRQPPIDSTAHAP
jgi:phosphoglycerol transferase MdoB-like AlkP superfamily enzyme